MTPSLPHTCHHFLIPSDSACPLGVLCLPTIHLHAGQGLAPQDSFPHLTLDSSLLLCSAALNSRTLRFWAMNFQTLRFFQAQLSLFAFTPGCLLLPPHSPL